MNTLKYILAFIFVFLIQLFVIETKAFSFSKKSSYFIDYNDLFQSAQEVNANSFNCIENDEFAATSYLSVFALGFSLRDNPDSVEAWKAVSKHADLRTNTKFLENISGYSDDLLKQLDDDLLNPKWADELKTLFKESPDDVTNVWKKLKQDPSEAWEISKADPAWEKWSQREFFKDVTVKGKGFERDVCLTAFKNRSSVKYLELKGKVSTDFGKNLDDYDMYSQVQLKYDGDNYFVADQLFVKYKTDALGRKVVDDVIVIENKLSSTTPLTTPQANAFQRTTFTVRSQSVPSEFGSGTNLTSGFSLTFSNSKQWYKVHDGANGDAISGIQKMQ